MSNELEKHKEALWDDYIELCHKYRDLMEIYEFGYSMVMFNTKLIMDSAPRHRVALETIRVATEDGIRWHVEEKKTKEGK